MIGPHKRDFLLSPHLKYHTVHVLRHKTFSSSTVLILTTNQHFPHWSVFWPFKYEGSTHLGKDQSLVFSRKEISICVGGALKWFPNLFFRDPGFCMASGRDMMRKLLVRCASNSLPLLSVYKLGFYISRLCLVLFEKRILWLKSLDSPCH